MPYSTCRTKNAHPEDVKAAVRKKVGSMASLARCHGVSDSVVRAALIRPQPTGNKIIADCLGVPLHSLWPEWYSEDGRRIPPNRLAE
ncbi:MULTISPECIES: helix-turn-helix domain-containing protein [Terasakiella]|uniref:helix-turn-helix domain-containing protein n=1 Tax=Terasakiella TaxID=196080 RepID=UPI00166674B1